MQLLLLQGQVLALHQHGRAVRGSPRHQLQIVQADRHARPARHVAGAPHAGPGRVHGQGGQALLLGRLLGQLRREVGAGTESKHFVEDPRSGQQELIRVRRQVAPQRDAVVIC
uniref:Putative secreted protein n=1 Tax=Ixodes ricinus TaxID=34613 RepID=A0A6B0UKG9_IXORI